MEDIKPKVNLEIVIDSSLLVTMTSMCDKLDIDYDELLEFLVIYAKTSLPLFKED